MIFHSIEELVLAAEEQNTSIGRVVLSSQAQELEESESALMERALGDHVFRRFQDAKAQEWADYTSHITPWELEHYLSKF